MVATCSSKRTDKLYVLRLELGQAKYFRLHVENTGLSTVRSCSGYITKITKRVGGQRIASEEEVLSLGWASYGQSDARDIPRGAFFHMDIATLNLKPEGRSTLSLHRLPSSLVPLLSGGKATYTFEILIASDNARSRKIPAEFTFDPARDYLEFEPVNRARYPWWRRWRWLRSRSKRSS